MEDSIFLLTCKYSVLFGFATMVMVQQEVFFGLLIFIPFVGLSAQQASLAFVLAIIGQAEMTIGIPTLYSKKTKARAKAVRLFFKLKVTLI